MNKKSIISKSRALLSMCLTLACVMTGLPNFMEANANSSSYYDEATVYDMSELSEGKEEAVISTDYGNSLGTLPTTENVAVQFKFTKPTGLNWGLKQRFLNPEPNNNYSDHGYYIFYHCQGRGEICILEGAAEIDQSGAKYSSTPFEFTGEQIVEIGAVNVYADATKTTKTGREIYVKVDGQKVVSYLDTTISDGDVGAYVTVPVVDGNLNSGSGKIKSAGSRFDEATVYDMSELSEGKEEAVISSDYGNNLGTLPTTENVAVQFKFTKPTGLNWGLKQRFLNPEPNNNYSDHGYYIFYHCQGRGEICILEGAAEIDQSGAKYSSTPFEFTGEHIVEVGAVNIYADATKTTKTGREIYVKVDGQKVVSYLDTTISDGDVGAYVTVPVVDGNFNENSGKVQTLLTYGTATVYDMSELSEGKEEAVISGDYENSLGTLPTTENVAVRFKFTKPTGLNWGLKQRFLNPQPNNNYNDHGYYIFYHCQGRGEVCILEGAAEIDQSGAKYSSTPFEFTGEQIVEIGAINVYANATKIGREIYVKVDGQKIVSYMDKTISDGDVGAYVTVPVVDGNFNENSGKLEDASIVKNVYTPEAYAEYRANNNEAPKKDGYVFAGWFSDEECKTVLETATSENPAYAKFVDAKVLTVKAQVTALTDAESDCADIRFVTTVDSLDYSEVGFDITIEGYSKKTISSRTVYEKLYIVGSASDVDELTPSEDYSRVSQYFTTYSYWKVPNGNFDTAFEVTPYWITLDGTIVYGETAVRTVAMSYSN